MEKSITYEIIEELGVISKSSGGWTTEVNLIRWNGNPAKIDIRSWSPERQKIGKGLTFTDSEAQELLRILKESI